MASTPSSHPKNANLQDIRAACQSLARCLGDTTFAIVGGASLVLLGSDRCTEDVDFVVPQGETKAIRSLLRQQADDFVVEPRINHTYYKSDPPILIEILTPPTMFREPFDKLTPTMLVNGVKILKPSLILNAKCRSVLGRADAYKKASDSEDIKFLLEWSARNNFSLVGDVPNATGEFVEWFCGSHSSKEAWKNAGWDFELEKFVHVAVDK